MSELRKEPGLFSSLFGGAPAVAPKTVDEVLGAFNKTLADLAEVKKVNADEAAQKRAEAEALLAQARSAQEEADRADDVRARFNALLNGGVTKAVSSPDLTLVA
jgi:hypothetical protein